MGGPVRDRLGIEARSPACSWPFESRFTALSSLHGGDDGEDPSEGFMRTTKVREQPRLGRAMRSRGPAGSGAHGRLGMPLPCTA